MRVFFALWPDESVRAHLEEVAKLLHRECGGKKTRGESIHLTLVFLGEVEKIDPLLEIASKLSANAFEIKVNRTGYWKHNRIAWAGMAECPELAVLVASLQAALSSAGFEFDERNHFPHVTLVRKAEEPKALPDFEPFSWQATEFCLVGSTPSGYSMIGRWPL
uniref:2',5' RNA ligase n=1 Tax=mine drainage metagenome TaxID=410659 RepID=E6QHE9_9ZZZZ